MIKATELLKQELTEDETDEDEELNMNDETFITCVDKVADNLSKNSLINCIRCVSHTLQLVVFDVCIKI